MNYNACTNIIKQVSPYIPLIGSNHAANELSSPIFILVMFFRFSVEGNI